MRLVWSRLAEGEVRALWRESVERWEEEVALRYLEDVREAAKGLGAAPMRARVLKGAFRILRVRSHYLIVHVDGVGERVTVARVLHVATDVERHLG